MKLPIPIIQRAHEMIVFSCLDSNEGVQKAFRLMTKKRYYLTLMKTHIALMHDVNDDSILAKKGGLKKPYIYNENIEDDVFCRNEEEQKN